MSVELPPLRYEPDEAHGRDLSFWAAGWDACMAWLWPMYQRSEADSDRYWAAAFDPSPKPKFGPSYDERRRLTAELQEQRGADRKGAA